VDCRAQRGSLAIQGRPVTRAHRVIRALRGLKDLQVVTANLDPLVRPDPLEQKGHAERQVRRATLDQSDQKVCKVTLV
jgi:hypothetical protein